MDFTLIDPLINSLPHLVILVDQNQRIVHANQSAILWGAQCDMSFTQYVPLIHQKSWELIWKDLIQMQSESFQCRLYLQTHPYRIQIHKYQTPKQTASLYHIQCFSELEMQWKRLLLSRTWCLKGLKHDLSNRIFLLSALPQLVDYSEPKDLLDDLTEDLPSTLEFFTHRLDLTFTENLNLNTSFGFSKEDQKKSLFQSLKEYGTRFTWVSGIPCQYTDQLIQTYLQSQTQIEDVYVHQQSLGIGWSLHHLALLMKNVQLNRSGLHSSSHYGTNELTEESQEDLNTYAPLIQNPPLPFTLHLGISSHLSLLPADEGLSHLTQTQKDPLNWIHDALLDLNRQILPQGSCVFLILGGGGIPWNNWYQAWMDAESAPEHNKRSKFNSQMSLGIGQDLSWKETAYFWIESWLNAAHMLQGGIISLSHLEACLPPSSLTDDQRQKLHSNGVVLYFPLSIIPSHS